MTLYCWLFLSGDDFTIIQQEILMMRDCRHENVVAYYGTYLRRDKLWICMEFCGGGSMQVIWGIIAFLMLLIVFDGVEGNPALGSLSFPSF